MSVDESAPTCHQPPLTCGLVEAEALRLDCALSKDNITRLAGFVGLLSRWSRRIRLTGSADASQIVTRQLADALVLSARLPAGEPAQRCVDVGAGGGLPGMACAAVRPDVQITFVEANARKCAFLRTAAHELGIRCDVVCARIEQVALSSFDWAWSRATFAPQQWLVCARGLLRPGGTAALFTAQSAARPPDGLRKLVEHPYALADGTPRMLTLYTAEASAD